MRNRIIPNDPGQPSVMSDAVEIEADCEPDRMSDPEFVILTRKGKEVGLFRRETVQAIYEVSKSAASDTDPT